MRWKRPLHGEWERLSNSRSVNRRSTCRPREEPASQRDLPPLATSRPRPAALRLYFRSVGGFGDRPEEGELLMPSEDLRAAWRRSFERAPSGPFGAIFAIVKSVAVEKMRSSCGFRTQRRIIPDRDRALVRRLLYRNRTSIRWSARSWPGDRGRGAATRRRALSDSSGFRSHEGSTTLPARAQRRMQQR